MARIARIVVPDVPHHVTQRGNNRQEVFFVDADRHAYLQILAEECSTENVVLLGYCLMSNHIHLIATPAKVASLARAVGRTHWRYTQYVNRLHGRSGHLWQNRFYSCPLGSSHLHRAVRYVERNPVRARMQRRAWEYAWSSAGIHVGMAPASSPQGFIVPNVSTFKPEAQSWKAYLSAVDDPKDLALLRQSTSRGRPLAGDSMMSKLEKLLGRRLRPLPVGRPKGKKIK